MSFHLSNPIMLSVTNKLKIFYSIIRLVVISVVNKFPSVETSTEMFSHYKAVFSNITIFQSHRVEEIFGIYSNMDIPELSFDTPSLPVAKGSSS